MNQENHEVVETSNINHEVSNLEENTTILNAEAETSSTDTTVADVQFEPAGPDVITHPNILKMSTAYQLIINNPEFYATDSKVNKFLDVCKLPDPSLKLWRSSLTHARKELNDKAMERARSTGSPVAIPLEEEISNLACDKFRESWKKVGKGKPMPTLPLSE